ncbi:hypothetical protein [Fulvivirga sp.]|uniref:hypothetical protein n=1 Tax=Fulvivirga sp. TaxID=1931237 RepID=UPI0032EFA3E2
MKNMFILFVVFFACSSTSEKKEIEQYIKIEYLGEQDYPFSALVISMNELNKSQIDTYQQYIDTLWVENFVVSQDLYKSIKDEVIKLSKRENKIDINDLGYDDEKVGFSIDVVEGKINTMSDEVWSSENSRLYLQNLNNGVNETDGAEEFKEKLYTLYVKRLFE